MKWYDSLFEACVIGGSLIALAMYTIEYDSLQGGTILILFVVSSIGKVISRVKK